MHAQQFHRLLRPLASVVALLAAALSASAQFTLNLSPVSPGTANLQFTRAPGYYYCVESSTDLNAGFTQASGWMSGDGTLFTWPVSYTVGQPANAGGGTTATSDSFSLYPFDNGKTLVSWTNIAGARYSAVVAQDYSMLPPLLAVPGGTSNRGLFLLVGHMGWDAGYDNLGIGLLPSGQQTLLTSLTDRHDAIINFAANGGTGTGASAPDKKKFFRIRRMEADADGDGIDWATEVFVLGTDPDKVDTDGDGYDDNVEIANGTDPRDPFDTSSPLIDIVGGDGQLAWTGQFDDAPLIVCVTNAEGRPIPNQTVLFSAPFASLAGNKDSTGVVTASFPAITNDDGYAFAFFRQPGTARATTLIHAQTQGMDPNMTASVDLWTRSVGGSVSGPNAPDNVDGEWIPGTTTEVVAYELSWSDTSDNEIEFVIERSFNDDSHWIPVGIVPAGATHWRDYALNLDKAVFYRVTSVGL